MADKYVDISATYNGDGTTSAQAASDGAAGAWNNLRNVMINSMTYGSYAAGDTIHVRTADAGGNLTESYSGTISTASIGTRDAPITFKFDDGVIWPQGGTFKHAITSSAATSLTINGAIIFEAVKTSDTEYGYHYEHSYTSHSNPFLSVLGDAYAVFDGCYLSVLDNSANKSRHALIGNGALLKIMRSRLLFNLNWSGVRYFSQGSFSSILLIDTIMDLSLNTGLSYVFGAISFSSMFSVYSCTFLNVGSSVPFYVSSTLEISSTTQGITFITKTDLTSFTFEDIESAINAHRFAEFSIIESECYGRFSSTKVNSGGFVRWAPGKNYPTQSALDLAGDAYSLKILPRIVNKVMPFKNNVIKKLWNGSATTVTVKQEFVIKDTSGGTGAYDNPKNNEWYGVVSYVDNSTSAVMAQFSSMDGSALTASSATWVPEVAGSVVYGAQNYDKYKIEITTDTSVKPDTIIMFTLYSTKPSIATDDFYFVDPDITLS